VIKLVSLLLKKKHRNGGINYVVSKHHERKIYDRINDEIKLLKDHANLQEQ